jgi:hypothetical protein
MSLSLLRSQKASHILRLSYIARSGEGDVGFGYIPYPEIAIGLSAVSYREFDGSVVVFSDPANEVIEVSPDQVKVVSRISPANNPTAPARYFPNVDGIVYRGRAELGKNNGLFVFTKSNNISTIIDRGETGEDAVGEIASLLYSPLQSAIYIIDEDIFSVHKLDTNFFVNRNLFSFEPADAVLQATIDESTNTIYLVDRGGSNEGRIQWVVNPENPSSGYVELDFEPVAVSWSPKENLLYVSGSESSLLRVYQWSGGDLQELTRLDEAKYGFSGQIQSLEYDPIIERTYAKVLSFYFDSVTSSSLDAAVYFTFDSGEIKRYYDLFVPYGSSTDHVHSPSRSSMYVTLGNTIREYKAINLLQEDRTLGLDGINVLSPTYFGDRSNDRLRGISGLRITTYDSRFQSQTVAYDLEGQAGYGSLSSDTSCVLGKWYEGQGDSFFAMAFDNGTFLLVNDNFTVITTIQTSEIILEESGANAKRKLINPDSNGPYVPSDVRFNSSFGYLYVCFPDGIVENLTDGITESTSGTVVVYGYDRGSGISGMSPIAYIGVPDNTFQSLISISIYNAINNLLVTGKSNSGNIILRGYNLNPEGITLSPEVSNPFQDTSGETSSLELFNGNTFFVDRGQNLVRYIGSSLTSTLNTIDVKGSLSDLHSNPDHQLLHILDEQENSVYTLNGAFELYSRTYLPGKPLALSYFNNYLYIVYKRDNDILPSLSESIGKGESANVLTFGQQIGVKVSVGDVIKIDSQSSTLYVVSLSESSPTSKEIFTETFTAGDDLTADTNTIISLFGEGIIRLNQEPIPPKTDISISDPSRELTLGKPGDTFYSLDHDPYLLVNVKNTPGFQTVDSGFPLLGDKISKEVDSPYFYKDGYLYFFDQNNQFYRANIENRWVQLIELNDGPDLASSPIRDILELEERIYVIFVLDPNIYSYQFDRLAREDQLVYILDETLEVGDSMEYMVYSQTEGLIRVYFTDGSITRVLP